jgi:rubredoxin
MSWASNPEESARLASDLQEMKHRAINLRLYATGEKLDLAIRTLDAEMTGHLDGPNKPEVVSSSQPKTRWEFQKPEAISCPDCGPTELEMRTYGGSWDDADFHCAKCGRLIHPSWSAV